MKDFKQQILNLESDNLQSTEGPIACLGLTFQNDEERRDYFLRKLREGLEELYTKLGGVPFTTVEDAVARLKSLEKWPVGNDQRIRELAERIRESSMFQVQGSRFTQHKLNFEL